MFDKMITIDPPKISQALPNVTHSYDIMYIGNIANHNQ